MEDIFHNPEFEKSLCGGVKDLDEPIGELVFNLWRAGIKTTWGCSGHIGKELMDVLGSVIPGFLVYQVGQLCYKPSERGIILTDKFREIKPRFNFVDFRDTEDFDGDYNLYLEMRDIARVFEKREEGYAQLQVPEPLARQRYEGFLEIWKELTEWSRGLDFKR